MNVFHPNWHGDSGGLHFLGSQFQANGTIFGYFHVRKSFGVIALMLLLGYNKVSGKINSSSPQTKEEMLAQIDALTKARHANDHPAKTQK